MNFTRLQDQKAMIGKKVTAIGCCGMMDGVEVEGILDRIEPIGAIVNITYGKKNRTMPALVNGATLRLKYENSHTFQDEQKMDELFSDLTKSL